MIPTSVRVCGSKFLMSVPTSVSASVSAFSNFVSTFGWTGVCIQTEYLGLSKSIQTISRQYPDRYLTDYIWTKSGQTDTGQHFFQKSGQNQDPRQTPDTIFRKFWTKTRQGQDTDSAVRRRLIDMSDTNSVKEVGSNVNFLFNVIIARYVIICSLLSNSSSSMLMYLSIYWILSDISLQQE